MHIVSLQPFATSAIPVCRVLKIICRYAKCTTLEVELLFQHFYNLLSSQNVLATKCNSKPQKTCLLIFNPDVPAHHHFTLKNTRMKYMQREIKKFHTPQPLSEAPSIRFSHTTHKSWKPVHLPFLEQLYLVAPLLRHPFRPTSVP